MRWKMFLLILVILFGSSAMGSELEQIRKAIREKGAKWEAADTWISKLPPQERKRFLGDNLADDFSKAPGRKIGGTKDTPTEFDWRNKDGHFWMTPVKDQENCGSCTAFGTVGALEANIKIRANNFWIMPNLSEQHLFSCAGGDCDYGMAVSTAMGYLLSHGTPDEDCLPYTQVDDNCGETCSDWEARARKVSTWGWTSRTNAIASIKQAIYDYGPVAGHFDVYTDFFSYNGGVYEHVSGEYEGGHCIVIVGWSDSSNCWICKNSWGPNWGEYGPYPDSTKGWFRIGYGQCEIEYKKAAWMVPIIKGPDGMVLDKEAYYFSLPPDSLDSDTLHISNVGDSTFLFATTFNQPWLFASPQSDTLDSNEVSTVVVSVNSSGLLGGVYAGTLAVSAIALGPGEVPLYRMDVPVVLDVAPPFIRGDYNTDGSIQMNDALSFLLNLFHQPGGYPPPCEDAADYNDDGALMMADALTELLFLFNQPGGTPPAPPYPSCGQDPTPDGLTCGSYPPCSGEKGTSSDVLFGYSNREKIRSPFPKVLLKTTPTKGEDNSFALSVLLDSSVPLSGIDLSLSYDPHKVVVLKVKNRGLISEGFDFFVYNVDAKRGRIRIGGVPDFGMRDFLVVGEHKIVDVALKFTGDPAASPTEDLISISQVHLYDAHAEELISSNANGEPVSRRVGEIFTHLVSYPNPFNSATEIRYTLPGRSYIRLEIFNVLGQRVATLVNGFQEGGREVVVWSGVDQGGNRVPSGIYFYRLAVDGHIGPVKKMLLLK